MGLEAATYIHQLNPSNPVGAVDPKAQGDDHLRLIKSTIQATFPSITGPVTVTQAQLNAVGGSGLTGFAAPSVAVGPAGAAAGVATTALRSDAKLVLDLTANYTFSGNIVFSSNETRLNAPAPYVRWTETVGALNAKEWIAQTSGGVWKLRVANDAFGVFKDCISISRGGAAVSDLSFGNATDNPTYNFLGAGLTTFNGAVTLTKGFNNTGNGAFFNAANKFGLDQNGAIARMYASGPNGATRGSYELHITDSTGALDIIGLSISNVGQLAAQAGAVGTPSYGYLSDLTSGDYLIAASNIGRAIAGVLVMDWVAAASGGSRVKDYGGTLQIVGFRNIPQNIQNANYTAVLADSAKHVLHGNGAGAGHTHTIPSNAAVPYDIGTAITFINRDSNVVSIAITADTLILANSVLTGTRTLAQNGIATAIKVAATTWMISGPGVS